MDLAFRAEVAEKLDQARKARGLNQSAAARELGITRQAFSQYLLQKATPQAAILARACMKWGLKLNYQGREFASTAFVCQEGPAPFPTAFQMDLFDHPQRVENDRVVVTLRRAEDAALQVTIRMKKASRPRTTFKTQAARAR